MKFFLKLLTFTPFSRLTANHAYEARIMVEDSEWVKTDLNNIVMGRR